MLRKKIFNYKCDDDCPENTIYNTEEGICKCSHKYYYDSTHNEYICLGESEECDTKGYNFKELDGNECFNSLNDCKSKGKKIFNNQCYSSCPTNTVEKTGDNQICICGNFYTEENGVYNCFDNDKACKEANSEYEYTNIQTKECFKTKNDCKNKNGNDDKCQYY